MNFQQIPRMTSPAHYRINVSFDYVETAIQRYLKKGLDLDPDFQRGHVWTESQQIAFVEFILRGGTGSGEIKFNCKGWMGNYEGPFVIVDGKQRLEAVRKFLRNELKAFGTLYQDFTGCLPSHAELIFSVNNLNTRKEVLIWYLEMNSGGTPHSNEELEKVQKLLSNCTG